MKPQRIFQAGNSQVVAIPKALAKELGLRVGHKVMMDKIPDIKKSAFIEIRKFFNETNESLGRLIENGVKFRKETNFDESLYSEFDNLHSKLCLYYSFYHDKEWR